MTVTSYGDFVVKIEVLNEEKNITLFCYTTSNPSDEFYSKAVVSSTTKTQGRNSQNLLPKFSIIFVTLGLKIL